MLKTIAVLVFAFLAGALTLITVNGCDDSSQIEANTAQSVMSSDVDRSDSTTAVPEWYETSDSLKLLVDIVYNTSPKDFLLKKLNGPDDRGFRIVYKHEGMRYTFDHDWWAEGIQIWVRPDGTFHPDVKADALSDDDMDGTVNFGTNGADKIYHEANYFTIDRAASGVEYQEYWQGVYEHAIAGLRNILDPYLDKEPRTVALDIKIAGCVCREYSEFDIHWPDSASVLFDRNAFTQLLIEADSSGMLLCDCSHGDGEKYIGVIKRIDPIPKDIDSDVGIRVVLNQKIYLDLYDIDDNLFAVLDSTKSRIFGINEFYLH